MNSSPTVAIVIEIPIPPGDLQIVQITDFRDIFELKRHY